MDAEKTNDALRALLGVPSNNASVNISADGGIAIAVGLVGAFALVVAVAAVIVVAIWRDADIRDMAQIRSRLTVIEAHNTNTLKRLSELENGDGAR
jgi:hypothetical protein